MGGLLNVAILFGIIQGKILWPTIISITVFFSVAGIFDQTKLC